MKLDWGRKDHVEPMRPKHWPAVRKASRLLYCRECRHFTVPGTIIEAQADRTLRVAPQPPEGWE